MFGSGKTYHQNRNEILDLLPNSQNKVISQTKVSINEEELNDLEGQ